MYKNFINIVTKNKQIAEPTSIILQKPKHKLVLFLVKKKQL